MTEPNETLLADETIPTVTLAGKRWPVPPLALKQMRVVVPILMKRMRELGGLQAGQVDALTNETTGDLITAVFIGLQRGHGAMKREEFEEMPVGWQELIEASIVVSRQAGMIGKKETNGVVGEAKGTFQTGAQ